MVPYTRLDKDVGPSGSASTAELMALPPTSISKQHLVLSYMPRFVEPSTLSFGTVLRGSLSQKVQETLCTSNISDLMHICKVYKIDCAHFDPILPLSVLRYDMIW